MPTAALIPGTEARFLAVGAAVWVGALAGRSIWGLWVAIGAGAVAVLSKRSGMVLVMVAGLVGGAWAGWAAADRRAEVLSAAVVEGEVVIRAVARSDPRQDWDRTWLLARPLAYRLADEGPWREWAGPIVMVDAPEVGEILAGEVFEASGNMAKSPGRSGASVYAARMWARELTPVSSAQGWLVAAGNGLRKRVLANLESGPGDGRALVAGFLVGDTSRLSPVHLANLRRSGLSHYVAVSGGNVALFLGALWLVMWPVATRPRLRALVGLGALGVFIVVTRWEPSVLRAALMAAIVMGGQGLGIPLGGWVAMGLTVILALLVSAELAVSLGFALSVAATAGVMVGIRLAPRRRPRWMWQTLSAAMAAQAAVAPLLLGFFGSLPLLSPVANLLATPLVAVSTGLGGIGAVTGWQPLVTLAAIAAEAVLAVADLLGSFPQLRWPGATAVGLVGVAAWRWRSLRFPVAAALLAFLAVGQLAPAVIPEVAGGGARPPAVVFLDVGQGDSILVLGSEMTLLIDGGPDPRVLAEKLVEYGVRELDVLVISHPHADHVRGLEAVVGEIPVNAVWDASHPHDTPVYSLLRTRILEEGLSVYRPSPGDRIKAGDVIVEVLGPLRRYKHINDQSIVLSVDLAGVTFLMAGDIEEVAQAEIRASPPDVLKVPHQGAATSDRGWLRENAGSLAVISVGPNDYGHPAAWVEAALAEGGARVVRTDRHGDVVVKPPSGG